MQGQVAETVDLVDLALVDGILPIHLEQALHSGSHLVDVRDVRQRLVFAALELQLAGQGILRLDPVLDSGHEQAGLFEGFLEAPVDIRGHLAETGQLLPVFLQDGFAVGVQVSVFRHNVADYGIFFKFTVFFRVFHTSEFIFNFVFPWDDYTTNSTRTTVSGRD